MYCPYCKEDKALIGSIDLWSPGELLFFVECECGASGPTKDTEHEAIGAWMEVAVTNQSPYLPVTSWFGDKAFGAIILEKEMREQLAAGKYVLAPGVRVNDDGARELVEMSMILTSCVRKDV